MQTLTVTATKTMCVPDEWSYRENDDDFAIVKATSKDGEELQLDFEITGTVWDSEGDGAWVMNDEATQPLDEYLIWGSEETTKITLTAFEESK